MKIDKVILEEISLFSFVFEIREEILSIRDPTNKATIISEWYYGHFFLYDGAFDRAQGANIAYVRKAVTRERN